MASPYPRRLALSALVLFGSLPILAAEPPGDFWQVTSKMSMEGMPFDMPVQTLKMCAAKNAQEPLGSANDERGCTNSDMSRDGNKVTWTSSCSGPPAMTGQGEITYEGTDSYSGAIKYVTDDGNMRINLTGHKIGGCDHPRQEIAMKKRLLGLALSVASLAANAAAPADPWTLVPALPTACYGEQDDFDEILATRIETLSAEISRQQQINDQLDDRVDALDPQEQMRRIMDYMTENPQEATKAMQAMQSLGSETTVESIQKEEAGEGEQTQALTALFARQDAALKTATDPIVAKRNKITNMAESTEFEVLSRQLDQEYVKLCPQWWKGGPFRPWLAGYREFLIKGIPAREEKEAKGNAQYAMFGISAASYRSTIKMEAVKKYLMRATEVYRRRVDHPTDWN